MKEVLIVGCCIFLTIIYLIKFACKKKEYNWHGEEIE